jgi:hypothetical protein
MPPPEDCRSVDGHTEAATPVPASGEGGQLA